VEHLDKILQHLAYLLSYPDGRTLQHLGSLAEHVRDHPLAAEKLQPFRRFVEHSSSTELEELFTRTFDMNPSCCLEIGWHLYGEDYERGRFLVRMRRALRQRGIPESIELPDHMSHCLLLLAHLSGEEAKDFAQRYLQPALGKILQSFDQTNPYEFVLRLLQSLLQHEYGAAVEVSSGTSTAESKRRVLNQISGR